MIIAQMGMAARFRLLPDYPSSLYCSVPTRSLLAKSPHGSYNSFGQLPFLRQAFQSPVNVRLRLWQSFPDSRDSNGLDIFENPEDDSAVAPVVAAPALQRFPEFKR